MSGTVPYWLDETYEPRPALAGRVETEACVIGAGVAGISCALALARRGVDVVVVERGTVASGASGRNGGFLIAGIAQFHNDARRIYGREHARRLYAATLAAQEQVLALAEELGAGDSLRRVGLLRASASEKEAEHVRAHAAALREDGFPGELLARAELPPGVARYAHNALFTPHDAALHPVRWYRLLGEALDSAGVRVHEGSPVEAPVPAPAEGDVQTSGGSVAARHVVVAADGALPALVPEYSARVRARRLHMLATEPLDARLGEPLVYSRFGFEYWHQRPDGRLLAGGFSDVDGEASYTDSDAGSDRLWERIERFVRDDLGAAAAVTHRWAGVVGYSEDSLPFVGEVPGRPGLYVAGGYSGVGNVPGFLAGRELADAIAGAAAGAPLFRASR
ncbi:MAG TPA: FAD-dependent oxidoreductase [Thermoleophilaceae bacterium]|nr:FAD-dependent oxidoreductase [Thermoleophilaceae bacterium]